MVRRGCWSCIVHSADHARAHVAQPCTQSCSWSTRVVIRSHRVLSRLVLISSHLISFAPLRFAEPKGGGRTRRGDRAPQAGVCCAAVECQRRKALGTKVFDRSAIVFRKSILLRSSISQFLASRLACDLLNRCCGTVRRRRRRWSKLRAKWSTTCPCEVPPGLQAATEVSESLCTQRYSRPLSTVLSEALARSHRSASIEAAARARFDDDFVRGACQDTSHIITHQPVSLHCRSGPH